MRAAIAALLCAVSLACRSATQPADADAGTGGIRVRTLVGRTLDWSDGPALERALRSPLSAVESSHGLLFSEPNARLIRQVSNGALSTFAGSGQGGYFDGPRLDADLDIPVALAAGPNAEDVMVDHDLIRRLDADRVTTLAGVGFVEGYADGPALMAFFVHAAGVTVDAANRIFIADTGNHRIRLLESGAVSTLAGDGQPGFRDGAAAEARFILPTGIAVAPDGTLVVGDGSHRLRRIRLDAAGPGQHLVDTLAGTGEDGLLDGPAAAAMLGTVGQLAVDPQGVIWFADTGNHRVRRLDPAASAPTVETVAGDVEGYADGDATSALFRSPTGVSWAADGSLLITDTGNGCIRRLSFAAGAAASVSTVAGVGPFREGTAELSVVSAVRGAALLPGVGIAFADTDNHRIRLLSAGRTISVAGDGGAGMRDGAGATARFRLPTSLAAGGDHTLFVADTGNNLIRRIELAPSTGSATVSTLAGDGNTGHVDGIGSAAELSSPVALAASADGLALFVAEAGDRRLRKIDVASGAVTTLTEPEGLLAPRALALSADGALFVADRNSGSILRRDAAGQWDTVTSGLDQPQALVVAADGALFAGGRGWLRRLLPTAVDVAGGPDAGFADGPASEARFGDVAALAWETPGPAARLVVADPDNRRLRVVEGLQSPR